MARSIKAAEPIMDLGRSRYVPRKRRDGVVTLRPSGLPLGVWLKGVLAAYCLLTFYKAFAIASLGAAGYEGRVAELVQGTPFEMVAARFLAVDHVTLYLANGLFPIF